MIGAANRIRELRERTGKTSSEIAGLVGLSFMEYFDLELHDDELEMVPSLAKVKRLALVLGVSSPDLFPEVTTTVNRMSYPALVACVEAHLAAAAVSRTEFEDLVGWELDNFFASEEAMLANYPVDFLKHLCEPLQVPWVHTLP